MPSRRTNIKDIQEKAQRRKITDLDDMRRVAQHVLSQNRKQKTEERYWAYYTRNARKILQEAEQCGQSIWTYIESLPRSKSMKNWLCAMFQFGASVEIEELRNEIGHAREEGDADRAQNHRAWASHLTHEILTMEPDYSHEHWKKRTHEHGGFTESGEVNRKKRKRRELRNLQPDWIEQLLPHIRDDLQLPSLVQALTGCRTSELVNGVHVWTSGSSVNFLIYGTKINQGHGQKWRQFSFETTEYEGPLARILFDHVRNEYTSGSMPEVSLQRTGQDNLVVSALEVKLSSTDAYRKHFEHAAARAGLQGVSPISFRHQMATNLKAENYAPEVLALVMGHCSDLTAQKHYGIKHSGRRVGLTHTEAEQNVRLHYGRKTAIAKQSYSGSGPTMSM